MKQLSMNFIVEKIEHCKAERSRLILTRNIVIMLFASYLFMLDVSGQILRTNFHLFIIITSFFYGNIALLHTTLEIKYRVSKYKEYSNLLLKYKGLDVDEKEAAEIISVLTKTNEKTIIMIVFLNHILYTLPIALLLAILYYLVTIFV